MPGCRASPEPANQAVIPFLCVSGKQRNFVSNNDFPRDRQWSGKQGSEGVKDSEEGREKERERERESDGEVMEGESSREAGRRWQQLECDRERQRKAAATAKPQGR